MPAPRNADLDGRGLGGVATPRAAGACQAERTASESKEFSPHRAAQWKEWRRLAASRRGRCTRGPAGGRGRRPALALAERAAGGRQAEGRAGKRKVERDHLGAGVAPSRRQSRAGARPGTSTARGCRAGGGSGRRSRSGRNGGDAGRQPDAGQGVQEAQGLQVRRDDLRGGGRVGGGREGGARRHAIRRRRRLRGRVQGG
mmetsp:Transcript_37592/g.121808  ORF Transcript_37592/g.121808 Transcript_37592/m.121808 type:complete len:200 (-) Transcript_37592:89-688(-)